ncbi:MAG: hypothetical protein ACXW0T_13860 [Methylobacter sp.]
MAGDCLKLLRMEKQSFLSALKQEIKMVINKEDNRGLNNINTLPCRSKRETESKLDVMDHKSNLACQVSKPKPTKEAVDIEALFQERLQRQLE